MTDYFTLKNRNKMETINLQKFTPIIFLQKFLPDFEQKYKTFENGIIPLGIISAANRERRFISTYFSEALQNCIDKICKEQRENCLLAISEGMPPDYKTEWLLCDIDKHNVINAEQPKIKELVTT